MPRQSEVAAGPPSSPAAPAALSSVIHLPSVSAPEPSALDTRHSTLPAWPEPVNGQTLLDSLRQLLTRFVVLPEWGPETLALWVLHTYAFQLRDVATYIGIESPARRCGKTTLLTILTSLVHRPVVAANISPTALFRAIEKLRPTLMIDEADTFLKAKDALHGILNAGYNKTGYVLRMSRLAAPKSDEGGPSSSSSSSSSSSIPPSPPPLTIQWHCSFSPQHKEQGTGAVRVQDG